MNITISELRAVAIEATETMHRLPASFGPSQKLGYWPDIQGEPIKDYAPDRTVVRVLPTSDQISRMERFYEALNRLESEDDRKEIYQWAAIQTSRNRTIRGYADKMGLREHEYRRAIDKIFQKVAVHFRINSALMSFAPVEQCREIGDKRSSSPEAYAGHWMAEDAKPRASDETPNRQNCMRSMLARAAERAMIAR